MTLVLMFLIIDKPKGWTSFDVVAKVRKIFNEKKVGHLGTLDPLATGVLVVAVGRQSTKQIPEYIKAEKEYDVLMELGRVSPSYDMEFEPEPTGFDVSILDDEKILEVMESFWGKSLQKPPLFSAKKVGGRKAYKAARQGEVVELKPVEVFMEGREIRIEKPFVKFRVKVSSGTYIRSLVNDIGEKLGCGAVLSELRRTRVGNFKIQDAKELQALINEHKL